MARTVFMVFIIPALLSAVGASAATDKTLQFRLKPGAVGNVCIGCHSEFQQTLKKAHVHTPVKKNDCAGCHNPHTSSHGKLLAAETDKVCATCHRTVPAAGAASVHRPAAEGKCVGCHDPHASGFASNLVRGGSDLCFGCHPALSKTMTGAKFRHVPAVKNCLGCHAAHASDKNPSLLKSGVPALCVGCHKTESPQFVKKHQNFKVSGSRCTSCHDPHGSDNRGLLLGTVHRPVQNAQCGGCHEDPASPLKLKKNGIELCKSCHAGMVGTTLGKNRQHLPLFTKKGCLTCHNPHAAPAKGLLRASTLTLCGSCHADTIKRQERSMTKHQPVKDGECTACHDPHASDNQFLAKQGNLNELCGSCHDWQKHSTHPIGEKFRDPRNRNLTLQCLSCHRSHGTEYKHFIPFATTSELCTQCHDQYRR